MPKVRVPLLGTIGKAVLIESKATIGAQIGTNLQLPDGTVPSLIELAAALGVTAVQASQFVLWQRIREVPANLAAIASISTQGHLTRKADATWVTRSIAVADAKLTVTNPAGDAGNPTIGFGSVALANLSNVSAAAVTNRFALIANGSSYLGRLLVEADISNLQAYLTSEVNDLTAAVTWANVPQANIPDPLLMSLGSVTTPSYSFTGDPDTGSFSPGANIYAIVVGGVEAVRYTGSSEHLVDYSMAVNITASTTQSQGEQPLTSSWNEIGTVANNNDVVTMPPAAEGRICLVINNGTNKLQLFPEAGDDLGEGVNVSVTIKSNTSLLFVGFDAISWHDVATRLESLQGVDLAGATNNDLFYRNSSGDWTHTAGLLTWDGSLFDITGDLQVSGKSGFYGTAAIAQPANITDAVVTHALNPTFSDTEVEAALDALGAKFNDLKNNVIEALGLSA